MSLLEILEVFKISKVTHNYYILIIIRGVNLLIGKRGGRGGRGGFLFPPSPCITHNFYFHLCSVVSSHDTDQAKLS